MAVTSVNLALKRKLTYDVGLFTSCWRYGKLSGIESALTPR